MKRGIGIALIGLGAFLVALAAMLRFYAVPNLAKAPLSPGEDTGGITVTNSEGTATALLDVAALASGGDPVRRNVPVISVRNTRGDVSAAESSEAQAQDLAIYDSFSRLTDAEGTVISADTLRVAFDRVSSELSNCCGANFNGDDTNFSGINPLKFPMFTQKQDYEYFDTTLGRPWPAVYSGTEEVEGATAYKFVMTIPPTRVSTMELPGSLVGSSEDTFEAARYYANERTLLVEPTTGSIVNGSEKVRQTLRGPAGTDAVTIIEASIGYTAEQISDSMATAQESAGSLNMLKNTIPTVGVILGVICLVAGIFVVRRSEDETTELEDDYEWDTASA